MEKIEEEESIGREISENEVNKKREVGRDLIEVGEDWGVNDESKIVRVDKIGKGEVGLAMEDRLGESREI